MPLKPMRGRKAYSHADTIELTKLRCEAEAALNEAAEKAVALLHERNLLPLWDEEKGRMASEYHPLVSLVDELISARDCLLSLKPEEGETVEEIVGSYCRKRLKASELHKANSPAWDLF